MQTLANLGILVTRPLSQAQYLCELIQQANGNPIPFPTLVIQALQDKTHLITAISSLENTNIAIFISQNAVSHTIDFIKNTWPILPPQLQFAAVGESTAQALRAQGFLVTIVPPIEFNSEGLLALADFQHISGKTITIFRGEGGRALLANTLRERGARVTEAIAYRRVCPRVDCSILLAQWRSGDINVVVSTSQESLVNLMTVIGDENLPLLFNTPLLVISHRMATFVQELGCKQSPIVAENARDEAIFNALQRWAATL